MNHISIVEKEDCCGCNACSLICPKKCITMCEDAMGSKYPKVDNALCIQCGACLKVCPFLNPESPCSPIQCYASVIDNDEIRIKSSSGGIFYSMAHRVIECGGIVFGAVFNKKWEVEHVSVEDLEGIQRMMGSKYVQSDTQQTYAEVRRCIQSDRLVLFSGTPCQIAGLNHYLHKEYDNLITVEVICHGVPERGVWRDYLSSMFTQQKGERTGGKKVLQPSINERDFKVNSVSFRDKKNGWKNFGFTLIYTSSTGNLENSCLTSAKEALFEAFQQNKYINAFLRNLSLRPSCYDCKAKSGKSHADITIGDFWGIEGTNIMLDDDKGISAIVCRTDKGMNFLRQCKNLKFEECTYQDIKKSNPSLDESVIYTDNAKIFHRLFPQKGFLGIMSYIDNPSFFRRAKLSLKHHISTLLNG